MEIQKLFGVRSGDTETVGVRSGDTEAVRSEEWRYRRC